MTVPYVFTVPELLDYFVTEGYEPSAEDVEEAGCRVGRNAYPALVSDLYDEGLLSPEVASVVVPSAWSLAEFPNRLLDESLWLLLFDLAGYTVDGVRAPRPAAPLHLWRGGHPGAPKRLGLDR